MSGNPVFEQAILRFLSPVLPYLEDETVSEVMINGPHDVWIERKGVLERTDASFQTSQALHSALATISQYAGRPFDVEHPILETHLPDGSRLEAVRAPIAKNGTSVAIRRFSKKAVTIKDIISFGTLSEEAAAFLQQAVESKKNIVVSGGTGSGKTSLLCALSSFVGAKERIVVIEDTHELDLQQEHVVYLEARAPDERGRGRITIRDLLCATLRLRPDRIVIGEIRGEEAIDLVQAMTSGHAGSLTTVHANTPYDAMGRFEAMILCSDTQLPHAAIRTQLASAVDLVVQIARMRDGSRKVVEIAQVDTALREGRYHITPLFQRDAANRLSRVASSDQEASA